MAEDIIRYDILAQEALRGLVRKVMSEVARTGLPGEHHFFVSFATTAPGVRISTRLLAQYPEEMTVVIQHQYWDLVVTEHAFEVGLSFKGVSERLYVPFAAVKRFADPSVGFELQFAVPAVAGQPDAQPGEADATPASVEDKPALALVSSKSESEEGAAAPDEGQKPAAAQVVSLDAFRKK
jgi:hypothetical protein